MIELSDFAKYSIRLKKCKKIYNIIIIAYILICLVYSLAMLFMLIISPDKARVSIVLDCIIFKPVEFIFALICCYKHKTCYGYFAVILQLSCVILNVMSKTYIDNLVSKVIPTFNANILILLIMTALAIILTFVNRSYIFLEQQAGFPYFDEKFEDQKFDAIRNSIKNDFQTKMEEYQKNAPDSMAELDHEAKIQGKPEDTSSYNTMESL